MDTVLIYINVRNGFGDLNKQVGNVPISSKELCLFTNHRGTQVGVHKNASVLVVQAQLVSI